MSIAQGIQKKTVIALQTGLGTPNVTSGQILRRRNSVFQAPRDMYESDEIVSHHQSTGSAYGLKKANGKLDGLLSPGTYQIPFEGLLEADFAAGGTITQTTIAAVGGNPPSFTDSGNGFLTAGFKIGDVVRASGFSGASTNSNARNFLITALTAGTMTGVWLDGGAVQVADAAGESVTIAVQGKKCKPPLTGHTTNYHSVEEFYSDTSKSELFTDMVMSQIALGLPASGNSTFVMDMVGRGRVLDNAAQQIAAHTVETSTPILAAINGFIYVNGAVVGNVTGVQLTISNGAADMGAVVSSNSTPDIQRGRIRVSGNFTGLYEDQTIMDLYDNETNTSLVLVIAADTTATSDFVGITLGRVKVTGDTPDDGEKGIVRTYPFMAELNINGGAALAWDQTILTVQDSQAS